MGSRTFFIALAAALIASATTAAITVTIIGQYQPFREGPSAGAPDVVAEQPRDAIVSIVERVSPAVVSVIATKDVPVVERFFESPFPNDPLFEEFFGPFFGAPREEQRGVERRQVAAGSGFVVRDNGLVATNRHVVDIQDAEFTVFFSSGERFAAQVVAKDPFEDLAFLQIEEGSQKFPALPLGDSDTLRVGETVIAIGNALGEFQNTVSVGVVSGLHRRIVAGGGARTQVLEEVIQTDAAINQGNSGGPLLNLSGEVVGVNTAIALGSENIGFAIPVNKMKTALESFEKAGRIAHAFLGVRYVPVTKEIAEARTLPVDYGALIVGSEDGREPGVLPGTPAAAAGLREGDVILEFNGERIDEERSLAQAVRERKPGDKVTLKILSAEVEKEVEVVLGETP